MKNVNLEKLSKGTITGGFFIARFVHNSNYKNGSYT